MKNKNFSWHNIIAKKIVYLGFLFIFFAFSNQSFSQSLDSTYAFLLNKIENDDVVDSELLLNNITTDTLFLLLKTGIIKTHDNIISIMSYEIINRIKKDEEIDLAQIFNDSGLNIKFKIALYGIISKVYRRMSVVELNNIFQVTNRDVSEDYLTMIDSDVYLSSVAITVNNDLISLLISKNAIDTKHVNAYCQELVNIMNNEKIDLDIRRLAIKGLQYCNWTNSIPILINMLKDSLIIDNEKIVRPICIALSEFRERSAIPLLIQILETTINEKIYVSALVSMATLGGDMALKTIIKNQHKFEGKYNNMAVDIIKNEIFEKLSEMENELTLFAITGTKYLFRDSDQDYARILLKDLLFQTSNTEIIKEILSIFKLTLGLSDKEEIKEILNKVPYNNEYSDTWNQLQNILNASPVIIEQSEMPVELNNNILRGNLNQVEYGDPGYQDNFFQIWGVGYADMGHAGLYSGINMSHNQRQIAMIATGFLSADVIDLEWSDMTNDPSAPFWGTYNLNNVTLTGADRRSIVNTAVTMTAYDYGYPLFNPWPDALNYISNPGTWISVNEITRIRCDGVVEYCYEWNNKHVWGKNQTHYDISASSYVEEHNDCFHWCLQSPCTALSPVVQCGGYGKPCANGNCTYLKSNASYNLPTYSSGYSANGNIINVTITATDVSGIHYIGYKVGSGGSWSYSPTQSQHPTSNSYIYSFYVNLAQPEYIYFFAIDNGGNYPVTASSIYVSPEMPPPQPGSISGPTDVCQGSTYYYSISSVSGATYYEWQLPSGWSGSSSSTSINAIAGTNGGTIRVRACNNIGCSSWRTLNVNVTPIPAQPGNITGPTTVCSGECKTYSISTVTGATSYTWEYSGGGSPIGSGTSITLCPTSNGMLIVRANNNCGSSSWRTLSITVNTIPSKPGSITGPTSVSQGSTNYYSISSVSGATYYEWELPPGWSGSSSSTSINATAGANGGTIWVRACNNCGCGSWRDLYVTVTSVPPPPGNISGPTNVCQGTTYNYSISSVSGATYYEWQLPSGWSGSSNSTSISATAGASGGTIRVKACNNSGCSSWRDLSVNVTIIPTQPGNITGPTSACQGTTYNYSISSVSGATYYEWQLPSGWSGSSSSTSISATAGASGGTIKVRACNSCDCSSWRTLNVNVTTIPAQPGSISGPTSVSQGSTNYYSISSVTGATYYEWELPSGWSGSSNSTSINATAGANGGTIRVRACNNCGCGSWRTLSVTVTSVPPTPGNISGSISVCQGTTYNYSISSVSGATYYEWQLPSGWSGSSNSTSISATAGASGGTIRVKACNNSGCSSWRDLSVNVTAIPAKPSTITANPTSPCKGSTGNTLSVTNVPGISYNWTYNGSGHTITSGQGTNSITVSYSASATNGTWTVTPSNSCGSGTARTLAITLSSPPARPSTITANPASPCKGSTGNTLSVTNVSGISYNWTYNGSGHTITSGQGTNSITVSYSASATNGTWTVTPSNSCGSGTARTLAITLSSPPARPSTITANPTSPCKGSTGNTLSVTNVSGISYNWTYNGSGHTITSGQGTNSITVSYSASATNGTWTVTPSNSCGNGTARTLAITLSSPPAKPGNISGPTNVCQGTAYNYSISSVSGATSYEWQLPSGWSGSSTSTSISAIAGANGGDIRVRACNNCGCSSWRTLNVNVTTIPAKPGNISGSTSVCLGDCKTYSISTVTGATSYTWEYTGDGSPVGSGTSISLCPTSSGTLRVRANNDCGYSSWRTLSITVNTVPAKPGSITGPATAFQGSSENIYSVTNVTGVNYNWQYSGTGAIINQGQGSNSITVSYSVNATSGKWKVTPSNNCGNGTARTKEIIIIQVPMSTNVQNTIINGNQSNCFNASQNITVAGNGTYFIVLPNGSVEFRAGQSIKILPATIVLNGGNFHAFITPTGDYCPVSKELISFENTDIEHNETATELNTNNLFFKIYPNPTTHSFKLDLFDIDVTKQIIMEMSNIMGEKILITELAGFNEFVFDISHIPPGMYVVRIYYEGQTGFEKLIKQ